MPTCPGPEASWQSVLILRASGPSAMVLRVSCCAWPWGCCEAHPGPKVVTAKWLPSKGFVAVCSGLTMPLQCPSPGCHGHVLVLRVPWERVLVLRVPWMCLLVLRVPWLRVPVLQRSWLCHTPAGVTPRCPSPECIMTARPGPEHVKVLCPDPEGATAVSPGAEGVVSLCHSPAGVSVRVSGS